jgi:hypothetical protein
MGMKMFSELLLSHIVKLLQNNLDLKTYSQAQWFTTVIPATQRVEIRTEL